MQHRRVDATHNLENKFILMIHQYNRAKMMTNMTNNKVNKVLKRLNALYFNKKLHVTTTTKWHAAYKDY